MATVVNSVFDKNATGVISDGFAPTGLQLLCSDYSGGVYDNTIEEAYDPEAGFRIKQGSSGDPDGNQFSNNGGEPDIYTDLQLVGFERFYQVG